MGVVVNKNGNHYYAHRIVLPDGTAFRFSNENENAAQELSRGVTDIRSLADTTSAAYNDSIHTSGGNVNMEKYSTGRGLEELAADNKLRMPQLTTYEQRMAVEQAQQAAWERCGSHQPGNGHDGQRFRGGGRTRQRAAHAAGGTEKGNAGARKKVYDTLFYPVTENNGRQIDWVNFMLDKMRTFTDSKGNDRELNRKERELVQKIVEYRASEKRVQDLRKQYETARQMWILLMSPLKYLQILYRWC